MVDTAHGNAKPSSSTNSIFQPRVNKPHKHKRSSLSCTNCQQRRVRCDRVRPCGACCAKGIYPDCKFINAASHEPVLQSVEIKRLRVENGGLKDESMALRTENEVLKARLDQIDSTGSVSSVGNNANSRARNEDISTLTAPCPKAVFVYEYGTDGVPPDRCNKSPTRGKDLSVFQQNSNVRPQRSGEDYQRSKNSNNLDKQQERLKQSKSYKYSQALQTPRPRSQRKLPLATQHASNTTGLINNSPIKLQSSTENALHRIARSGNYVRVLHEIDPPMGSDVEGKQSPCRRSMVAEPAMLKRTVSPIVSYQATDPISANSGNNDSRPFSNCSSLSNRSFSNQSFDSTASFNSNCSSDSRSSVENSDSPFDCGTFSNAANFLNTSNDGLPNSSAPFPPQITTTTTTMSVPTTPFANPAPIPTNPFTTCFTPTMAPATTFDPQPESFQEPFAQTQSYQVVYHTSVPQPYMTEQQYHTIPWSEMPPNIQSTLYAANPDLRHTTTTDCGWSLPGYYDTPTERPAWGPPGYVNTIQGFQKGDTRRDSAWG